MTERPGVGGSLFPSAFLAAVESSAPGCDDPRRPNLVRWWKRVERQCGPATALRALFDIAAMPLAGLLGFRARDARFSARAGTAVLDAGGTRLQLVLLPWSARLPAIWRDLHTEHPPVQWGLVIAPPFVSVVDLGGHAVRRSVDFRFPHVLDARSIDLFLLLCQSAAFAQGDRSGMNALVEEASAFQGAVRRDLQHGVTTALARLTPWLRGHSFDEALTIVYRLLFLLFAESRHLTTAGDEETGAAYGLTRLCRDTWRTDRTRGLWSALAAITRLSRAGCQARSLIVAPFNGHLFSREAAPTLEVGGRARQANRVSAKRDAALGEALVALGSRPSHAGREEISYADLGVEQLGAVYERVLDLDPETLASHRPHQPSRAHSARRKEHGTFYTPQPLAEYVVRRTLAPLVRHRTPDELLRLRIVDPAMGSGAFLVAACRYLADAYERALIDEGRYGEGDFDEPRRAGIRRLVAARCLAGVDVNPTAVQLARLSLWLATLARDKPLSFLDHQLRAGNSLIGATPGDLWRARQRTVRGVRDRPLFEAAGLEASVRDVLSPTRTLRARPDDTVADVHARERLWREISSPASPVAAWRLACDLWCSQWFTGDGTAARSSAGTRAAIDAVLKGDRVLPAPYLRHQSDEARNAAARERFFHWPLEFPDVFHDDDGVAGSSCGFDAVIGNPPWEILRRGDGTSHSRRAELSFIRESGFYPSCGRGHLNLYQPFVERALALIKPGGRAGLIVPWSLATDDGSADLRRRLLREASIDSLVGLDNAQGLFPIHRGLRFAALVVVKGQGGRELGLRTGIKTAAEIEALSDLDDDSTGQGRLVRVSPSTLQLVSGSSLRIPDARSRQDLDWLARLARRYPPLGSRDGWHLSFGRELNATEDRSAFGTDGLPVIEGKHIAQFTVMIPSGGRRIDPGEAARRLPDRRFMRARLAYRDVSGVGNRHTVIAAIVPASVVTTHTLFCLRQPIDDERQHYLCGLLNSPSLNAWVRMFMGSHVTTSLIEQMPVPPWRGDAEQRGIAELAAVLSATPDGVDRSTVRSELDGRVARLYAIEL